MCKTLGIGAWGMEHSGATAEKPLYARRSAAYATSFSIGTLAMRRAEANSRPSATNARD